MSLRMTLLTTSLLSVVALAATAGWTDEPPGPGSHFLLNWDMDADGAVSAAEVAEKRAMVFVTFDADEDGILSPEEYAVFDEARANDQAAMREEMAAQGGGMGHGPGPGSREDAGMALAFNDVDGDGRVTREEFLARTPDFLARLDRDGDGAITPEDFGRG